MARRLPISRSPTDTIANPGTAGTAGAFQSAIAFNGSLSGLGNNINGTLTVTGNTFTNPHYSGLDVQSDNGTVTSANVSNNTVTNPGFSGINFVGTGNASTAFNVNGATINQNNISGSGGNGIQVSISNASTTGPGATAGIPNDASNRINITNNSVTSIDSTGTQAITYALQGANSALRSRGNFLIQCNGKNSGGCTAPTASPLASSAIGTVLLIGNNGYATATGIVDNNSIVATQTPNMGGGNGIAGGNGTAGTGNTETPLLTLTVTNNSISGTDGNGILLVGRGVSGTFNLRIAGNTVRTPVNARRLAREGIRVDAGNATSGDDAVCTTISGNTSAGSNGAGGIGIRKQGTVATTNDFGITGLAPSPATGPQAASFVAGQNPAGNGVDNINGDNFVSCATAPP